MARRRRRFEFRTTNTCPVCAKAGCLVSGPRSAPVAAVCGRVESPKPVGSLGYVHVLDTRGPVFHFTPAGRELVKLARNGEGNG